MIALTFSFSAANAEREAQPELAFLEYLAELENVDGKWVDAFDLANSDEAESLKPSASEAIGTQNADTEASTKSMTNAQAKPPVTTEKKEVQQ